MAVSLASESQGLGGEATGSPVAAFRTWATKHRVLAAMLAGFVAVHVGTIIAFWFGWVGLTRLDWPTANGLVYVPDAGPTVQFILGGAARSHAGFFSTSLGWNYALSVMIFHVIYGPHLGLIYNPHDEDKVSDR